MNMFKSKSKPKANLPQVGMRLEDTTWGKDYTEIEIIKVSKNNKEVIF